MLLLLLVSYGAAYRLLGTRKYDNRLFGSYETACFFAPAAQVESFYVGRRVIAGKLESTSPTSVTFEPAWSRTSTSDRDYSVWIKPVFLFALCFGVLGVAMLLFRRRWSGWNKTAHSE
jgi:hypothetical protein